MNTRVELLTLLPPSSALQVSCWEGGVSWYKSVQHLTVSAYAEQSEHSVQESSVDPTVFSALRLAPFFPPPHHPTHTTFCFNFPPLEIRRQTRIILLLDSISILWCFVGWKGFWELKGWSVFLDFKYVHKLSSVVHKKCYKSYLRVRSFEHLRCPLKQI